MHFKCIVIGHAIWKNNDIILFYCFFNKENTSARETDHEAIKLTKDISLDEEEEEVTENYLKIYAKYITDGQVKRMFVVVVSNNF